MSHRITEIKPDHLVSKKECQEMIDKAIDKHNKTATIISAILGGILLTFYSHGVLSLVGRV
jgi:predicted nucleic acid-binding Zn ribbon protein